MPKDTHRLKQFLSQMRRTIDNAAGSEARILAEGAAHLRALVAQDDWLPESCAQAHPDSYQQYLLYCDPDDRFSVVSFVWGPGQETPVHDHTVWGLVGMLRGTEVSQSYAVKEGGLVPTEREVLRTGEVVAVSPTVGDIHKVSNAEPDRTSISIHVYGGDIGAIERHVFDETGQARSFVSGYSNTALPNLWGSSA